MKLLFLRALIKKMISAEQIKKLRDQTSLSIIECKKALEQAHGDEKKALEILGGQSQKKAAKKAERKVGQGIIESYIHSNGKVGVILQLFCETDFVANNKEFKELSHDLAMHIAAMESQDIDELLKQPFIKNQEKTIKDLINDYIAKLGENIKIGKFIRLEV